MQVHYRVQNSPKTCHDQPHQRTAHIQGVSLTSSPCSRIYQGRRFGHGYVILSGMLSDTNAHSSYDSQSADRLERL